LNHARLVTKTVEAIRASSYAEQRSEIEKLKKKFEEMLRRVVETTVEIQEAEAKEAAKARLQVVFTAAYLPASFALFTVSSFSL
jgi:hypothetical protein